jgi:hypothetical protein
MTVKPIILILALAAIGNGATIEFMGAPTGVNDGIDYVLPYQVTIDGMLQDVACFDSLDSVGPGDIWQANVLDLSDAAASGFFADGSLASYERVAWLSAQPYSDVLEQIGLQYAIWNVFDSVTRTTAAEESYSSAADAAAANNYAGFDFGVFRFIQEIGATAGASGTEQAFVFDPPPSSGPEPSTVILFGSGILLLVVGRLRR